MADFEWILAKANILKEIESGKEVFVRYILNNRKKPYYTVGTIRKLEFIYDSTPWIELDCDHHKHKHGLKYTITHISFIPEIK